MNPDAELLNEVGQLAAALCDGELAPDEAVRLEQLVTDSDEAQAYFLQYIELHGELYWEQAASAEDEVLPGIPAAAFDAVPTCSDAAIAGAEASRATLRPAALHRPLHRAFEWMAAAGPMPLLVATLALGVGLIVVTLLMTSGGGETDDLAGSAVAASPVARLTNSIEAQWSDESSPGEDGELMVGQVVELVAGLAEIEFYSGATMIVEAPARVRLGTASRVYVEEGTLSATVPPEARGFRVDTPLVGVIDLGTQFGMAVEPGGCSEVHVFEGLVDVVIDSPENAESAGREVAAGQAVEVRVPAEDDPVRIESITPGRRFVRHLPPAGELAGSVARLRRLVSEHPHLMHHYTFEGNTLLAKRQDRRGTLHLVPAVMHGGRGDGNANYWADGFDVTSTAFEPFRAATEGNNHGEALQSESAFLPPEAMTLEMLLRFDGFMENPEGLIAGAVATRAGDRDCGFFVTVAGQSQLAQLMDARDDWVESTLRLVPGEWYYLAATFQEDDGHTRIDTYVANLSRGDRQLRRVVADQLAKGTPATSRLGIGKGFDWNIAHAYPWAGALDEIAVYDTVLSQETLSEHLRALVGEGSTHAEGGERP